MDKELRDYIKKLSEKDKKTITQKALKCAEETGELARKVLPYENAHGTTHRFITNNSILEEVADVVLTAMSIGYELGYSHDEIDDMIRQKSLNWQAVQAKSDRVEYPIPFEMHITIRKGDGFDVSKYVDDCEKISKIRGNKIKPIVLDLENGGASVMQDVMTSSHYFGDNAGAYHEAKAIETSMKTMGYDVVRVKIETVPWHPAAPIESGDKMPGDCYFEAHIGCIISIDDKYMLSKIAEAHNAHMSRNFFKKIDGGKFVNMITLRTYEGTYDDFTKKLESLKENLTAKDIRFDKVITEFSIYDTKVSHDFLWIDGKSNNKNDVYEEFLKSVIEECKQNNVECVFSDERKIAIPGYEDILVSGFFDDLPRPILGCAMGKPTEDWVQILVHESCHMNQWMEQSEFWKRIRSGDIYADKVMDEWLSGREFDISQVEKVFYDILALELDCEKRSVDKIKNKNLPIDTIKYTKGANAYLFYYPILLKTRKWSDVAPYEVSEIIEMMPDKFLDIEDYYNASQELIEIYLNKCFKINEVTN